MKYNSSNKPIECIMTQSKCYKETSVGIPVGILWHDTNAGNPTVKRYVQPSDNDPNKAQLLSVIGKNANRNDWNHQMLYKGVNAFIGKLANGEIASVKVLPWDYRPWGCGSGSKGSCNGTPKKEGAPYPFWIQFEICDDGYKDYTYFSKVYKEAVELTAYLCKLYNINPRGTVTYKDPDKNIPVTVPTILCHSDSGVLGLGSGHSDVYLWFNKFGKTMNMVRSDVESLLSEQQNPTPPQKPADNNNISVGDIVEIIGTKYYSGGTVPNWVKSKKWVVYSVRGDRIVLNESEDGTATIMSPFRLSDLKKCGEQEVVETGDLVKITGTTYYSGANIPQWVLKQNWYVHFAQDGNNRVVVNQSENGKCCIMSAINRNNLKVITKHN